MAKDLTEKKQCCGNCRYSRMRLEDGKLLCAFNPPTVTAMQQMSMTPQGPQASTTLVTMWPCVTRDERCSKFETEAISIQ